MDRYNLRILYSSNPNTSGRNGVGIIVNHTTKTALMEWQPISDRIITVRCHTKFRNISTVQCYAPTEDADPEAKTEFYVQLEATISSCKKSDSKIVLGNFNAKFGAENTGLRHIMGRYGIPSHRTDNGNRLIDIF
jgi:exonuclease III